MWCGVVWCGRKKGYQKNPLTLFMNAVTDRRPCLFSLTTMIPPPNLLKIKPQGPLLSPSGLSRLVGRKISFFLCSNLIECLTL
jgi:hypothetical protein